MNPNELVNQYNNMNVIVLGAAGFIGRWVARKLSQCGANLSLIVRDTPSATHIFNEYNIRGNIIELDLMAAKHNLPKLFEHTRPHIVFNLVGYGVDPSERDDVIANKINAELPAIICNNFSKSQSSHWPGQDIINIGSALEYGEIGGDLSEVSTPNPTTIYGQTILKGTNSLARCCQMNNKKGITVRLFTVYGPGEHTGRLLPSLIEASQTTQKIPLTEGRQKRDFTYVEEVAEGILRIGAIKSDSEPIVNLASGSLISVRSFIETTAKLYGIDSRRLSFGSIATRNEEMSHEPVSNSRLLKLIHWKPIMNIQEGILSTQKFSQ